MGEEGTLWEGGDVRVGDGKVVLFVNLCKYVKAHDFPPTHADIFTPLAYSLWSGMLGLQEIGRGEREETTPRTRKRSLKYPYRA